MVKIESSLYYFPLDNLVSTTVITTEKRIVGRVIDLNEYYFDLENEEQLILNNNQS